MRRYLDAISPLSHAEKIRVPLLVATPQRSAGACHRGRADRAQGAWQRHTGLVRAGRGRRHGFTKKSNVDYLFAAQTLFLDRYLQRRN
jgi:hypothetical protein